jgi:hypothetical protein
MTLASELKKEARVSSTNSPAKRYPYFPELPGSKARCDAFEKSILRNRRRLVEAWQHSL